MTDADAVAGADNGTVARRNRVGMWRRLVHWQNRILDRFRSKAWFERVFPQRVRPPRWNRSGEQPEQFHDALRTRMRTPEEARATLEHVQSIAQTAVDRADAADRRATTIAGTVAIAAGFTMSGAGLVLNENNGTPFERSVLASVLFFTTVAFAFSAYFALRASTHSSDWSWSDPGSLTPAGRSSSPDPYSLQEQLGTRAAYLRWEYAKNWEMADLKNRNVHQALRWLMAALVGLGVVAGLVIIYVATS